MSGIDTLLEKYTAEQLTGFYLKLREKKKLFDDEYKEAAAKQFGKPMGLIEGALEKLMLDNGLDSLPNAEGTPYKTIRTTVRITDWDTCQQFIEENNLQHWYTRAASKEGVEEYVEAHGELPPGVMIAQTTKINVRKAK